MGEIGPLSRPQNPFKQKKTVKHYNKAKSSNIKFWKQVISLLLSKKKRKEAKSLILDKRFKIFVVIYKSAL